MKAMDTVQRNKDYHCLEYDHDQMGDIFLVACGQEKCDPGVTYGPDLRDCYHLHVVREGCGALKVYGKTFHPRKGQMFLLKHNETVTYTADLKDPWHYCWVTFHGSEAAHMIEEIGFTEGIYCLDSAIDPEARSCYKLTCDCSPNVFTLVQPLAGGDYAVGIFNFGEEPVYSGFTFWDMGLSVHTGLRASFYDCMEHKALGLFSECFSASLTAHDARVYRVSFAEG